MAMHDGHDIGAYTVDLAVDETFAIGCPFVAADGLTVEVQLHDVRRRHLSGRDRSRDQVSACPGRRANADVAEGVDDLLRDQDMVGGHDILDQRFAGRLLARQPSDQRGRTSEQESAAWRAGMPDNIAHKIETCAKLIWPLPRSSLVAADSTYQQEISQWRAEREAKLKADDGWLTVVGLHWLHEGVNTVGSDPKADAPLPSSMPARVGTITLSKGKAHFKPAGGVQLKEMDLKTDITEQYDRLALGRVKFFVIERETKFGVRVKNNDSEARKRFAGAALVPGGPGMEHQGEVYSLAASG